MKKKLDEINRKIWHSRKKCDGMIHKRNALRKVTEGLKSMEGLAKGLEWDFKELSRGLEVLTEVRGLEDIPEWMRKPFFNK